MIKYKRIKLEKKWKKKKTEKKNLKEKKQIDKQSRGEKIAQNFHKNIMKNEKII